MGGIGAIIGGALSGVGEGLSKQAAVDMAREREMALEALRTRNRRDEMTISSDLNDRNAGRQAAREFSYGTQAKTQDFTHRKDLQDDEQGFRERLAGIEHGNRVALEKAQHKYRMTEGQADDARQFAEEAKRAGTYIDRYEITADGQMIGYTKSGKAMRSGAPGTFVPPGSKSDDDDEISIGGAREERKGAPAQQASAAPKEQAKTQPTGQGSKDQNFQARAQAVTKLAQVYATATPDKYPGLFRDGKKISMEEAKQMILQRYGKFNG